MKKLRYMNLNFLKTIATIAFIVYYIDFAFDNVDRNHRKLLYTAVYCIFN